MSRIFKVPLTAAEEWELLNNNTNYKIQQK